MVDEGWALPITAIDVIPADHPCLPGHFPGSPIVPAVVLLDRAARALAANAQDARLGGLLEAKFLRPIRPDQRFTIGLESPKDGCARLEIRDDQGFLASGRLLIERPADV